MLVSKVRCGMLVEVTFLIPFPGVLHCMILGSCAASISLRQVLTQQRTPNHQLVLARRRRPQNPRRPQAARWQILLWIHLRSL